MHTVKDAPRVKVAQSFEVPSVPVVLMKILQLVDDDRASARRLEELILHDPSLSARILKLANSAFYCFRCEVKTISHAIALLGLNLVKSLAIGVSIFESFMKGMRDESAHITQLWMHSFGVGMISQDVVLRRANKTEGEFAFLCGLLHDLGQVVFFKQDPRGYHQLFAADKSENGASLSAREMEQYGVTHCTLGSMLARKWGLPPELATVARYHHDPLDCNSAIASAVAIADSAVRVAGIGYDGDSLPTPSLAKIQEQIQMSAEDYERLCVQAGEKKKDVEDFFLVAF